VVEAVVVQTSWPRQRLGGVTADESGVAEGQIHGVRAHRTTASPHDLRGAGLPGMGESLRALQSCNLAPAKWRIRPSVGYGDQRRWLSLAAWALHVARAGPEDAQHRAPAGGTTNDTTSDRYAGGGTGGRPPPASRPSMHVQHAGGKSTMVQQSRTIQGMLVLWGLSLALVIAGCGGGEDTSTSLTQQIPPHVASPQDLHMQGFRFSTGEPFHIDPTVLEQGDVLLFFGDFQSTTSAPFTLVAGGYRATGIATWLNIYTLSVQESTFPAASSTQGALGPQVGDQLLITINLTTMPPQAQEVSFLNGVRDFTRTTLIGNPIQISRRCDTKAGETDPVELGTLGPAGAGTSRGCTVVNGSINNEERDSNGQFFADTFNLAVQPADQIIQFILTFPRAVATDFNPFNFNLIIRRKDHPNITDNTNVLQACVSTRDGQEACSIVLQQPDFAAASPLPIEITVQAAIFQVPPPSPPYLFPQGTGNYTLEIVSTVSPEVGNRTNICLDMGPSTILEQETNGSNGKYVVNPNPPPAFITDAEPQLFQDVGMLHAQEGCLAIRGGKLGASIIDAVVVNGIITNPEAEADGFDKYTFSVENTVSTVAFLLKPTTNLTNNALSLVIDDPTPPITRLAQCYTTYPFNQLPGVPVSSQLPGTPVTCTVAIPPSRTLRVGVFSAFVCPTRGCIGFPLNVEMDYSLDIIAVARPNIVVNPIPCSTSPDPSRASIIGVPRC